MSESHSAEVLWADLRQGAAAYPAQLREIEISLAARELRRVYVLMARLKESGQWLPSPEAEAALEDFWWEYGQ
jgi:hypothetical protein